MGSKKPDTCERCHAEAITTAGDHVADYAARLCSTCGALWLRTVLGDWDASLRLFTGAASEADRRAHADQIARRDLEEADRAYLAAKRNAAAEARKLSQRSKAEQDADDHARAVLAVVTDRPRPTLEIASELGVSGRTAGRYVALAKRKGLVRASGRDIVPAQESQQRRVA